MFENFEPQVRYRPGTLLAIVTATTMILADSAEPERLADQLWEKLQTTDPQDLMTLILDSPLRSARSFGLLRVSGDTRVALLRGNVICFVKAEEGFQTVDPGSTTTWLEHQFVPSATAITLTDRSLVTSNGATFPMRDGAGLASAITVEVAAGAHKWRTEEISPVATATNGCETDPVATPTLQSVSSPTASPEEPVAMPPHPSAPTPESQQAPLSDPDDATIVPTESELAPLQASSVQAAPSQTEIVTPENLTATDEQADSEANPYDAFLFGSTIRRSIEAAEVRIPEDTEPDDGHTPIAESSIAPIEAETDRDIAAQPTGDSDEIGNDIARKHLDPVPQAPSPQPATNAIIDELPWALKSNPEDPTPTSADATALHQQIQDPVVDPKPESDTASETADGLTISRSQLRRLRRERAVEATSTPFVQAIFCNEDHPNPPTATNCRICSVAIGLTRPTDIPRPPLGRLVLSTGDELILDRPVLIGRDPSSDRLINGENPHLVKLSSPDREISRNHAEIQLDGWRPILIDLKSLNGTRLTMPGLPMERLRPGNRYPLVSGAIIDLGDEITVTYLVDGHA